MIQFTDYYVLYVAALERCNSESVMFCLILPVLCPNLIVRLLYIRGGLLFVVSCEDVLGIIQCDLEAALFC